MIYVYYNILIVKIYSIDNTCFEVHFCHNDWKGYQFLQSDFAKKKINRMVKVTYAKTLYKDINKKYAK